MLSKSCALIELPGAKSVLGVTTSVTLVITILLVPVSGAVVNVTVEPEIV